SSSVPSYSGRRKLASVPSSNSSTASALKVSTSDQPPTAGSEPLRVRRRRYKTELR
ncbi:hypothetical protein HAX54_004089, partial [Datura stramonium]|nr:hypothetical protein [Datura stramonium]